MRQVRTIRYREIADARCGNGWSPVSSCRPALAERGSALSDLRGQPGDLRRALEQLKDEGLVDARQGFGWFVAARRSARALGRLATLEDQLAASGIRPDRQILDFAFVPADDRTRTLLGHSQVLRVRRLNLADGEPFAIVTVWCPASLGQHLSAPTSNGRRSTSCCPFVSAAPARRSAPTPPPSRTRGCWTSRLDPRFCGANAVTRTEDGDPVLVSVHLFPRVPDRVRRRHAPYGAVDRADRLAPRRVRTTETELSRWC